VKRQRLIHGPGEARGLHERRDAEQLLADLLPCAHQPCRVLPQTDRRTERAARLGIDRGAGSRVERDLLLRGQLPGELLRQLHRARARERARHLIGHDVEGAHSPKSVRLRGRAQELGGDLLGAGVRRLHAHDVPWPAAVALPFHARDLAVREARGRIGP
jgi:hypothetical protein